MSLNLILLDAPTAFPKIKQESSKGHPKEHDTP